MLKNGKDWTFRTRGRKGTAAGRPTDPRPSQRPMTHGQTSRLHLRASPRLRTHADTGVTREEQRWAAVVEEVTDRK